MGARLYRWTEQAWYGDSFAYWFLLPLSGLYWVAIAIRRLLYRLRIFRVNDLDVPVVVVGNITAGGTGKTPITAWLAQELARREFRPGIVSRGYGGAGSRVPVQVDAASNPAIVGDEPVLLAKRAGCPVAVCTDRVEAARMLIDEGADVIIADDGLQHLALGRDYEICIVDGERRFGNGMLLPAGPLRETTGRLALVDQLLVNGSVAADGHPEVINNAIEFRLAPTTARRLDGAGERPPRSFSGKTVHAVAAIGNPQRFFSMLRSFGMQVLEHPFADHAPLSPADVDFADGHDVLMTEKDAVKLGALAGDRYWYVPVDVEVDKALARPWLAQLVSRLRNLPEPT
jgi:tetraacyldisaccharide 4'-kinase